MPTICQKLQLKAPYNLLLLNAPGNLKSEFEQDGSQVTEAATTAAQGAYGVVQLFVTTKDELDALAPQAVAALKPNGILWVAYPKKSSGIKSDLTRDYGWETIKELGYEGVRMISVDDTWSSLRLKHGSERKAPSKFGVDYPGIDRTTKTVTIPDDLLQALHQAKLVERFEKLAFTHRKEHVIALLEAKRPETRQSRIQKIIEKVQA